MSDSCFSRRQFVERLAKGMLGVSLIPNLVSAGPSGGTARRVIYLFMEGGMSHLDTFDLKTEKPDIQGPVKGIPTSVSGVRITEHLPLLSRQMHHLAQVRSLSHTQGNHEVGQYHMRTGYKMAPGVVSHPALGAWVTRQADRLNPALPPYVRVGSLGKHPVNGFLPVSTGPVPISSASSGLQNSQRRETIEAERFEQNLALASRLEARFQKRYQGSAQAGAYAELYAEAVRLMSSKDLEGFDIALEPESSRERYGDTQFGAGCLLARRLVERDVQFVEVDLGGWDTHTDNHKGVAERCAMLDQPLSALLDDLSTSGLLEDTLVVVATEFGRTPLIDQYAGRGHHPIGYTCLLAGGGVSGGAVFGKTEADGSDVADDEVSVLDFNATIAHALGLPLDHFEAPFDGGQMFSLAGKDTGVKGAPILPLFS